MARRVFFSFHYQRDIWRVNQIRNSPNIVGASAAGFQDGSLWEEAKKKGDAAIKRLIDGGLQGTSVTVVCVGSQTAGRKYVNYEIDKSLERGNGLVAVQIHHVKNQQGQVDSPGRIPPKVQSAGYKAYKYLNKDRLAAWVEEGAKTAGK